MAHIIHLDSVDCAELDVYARLTEAQIRNRLEPEKGVFRQQQAGSKAHCGKRDGFSYVLPDNADS